MAQQLSLFQPESCSEEPNHQLASQLQEAISRLVAQPVHLTITDNTYSMIHISPFEDGYAVRLHHMFLGADSKVLEALARFIKSRNRKAPALLRNYVAANSEKIRRASPRPRQRRLRHAGRFFNVKEIFDQVNHEYFDGKVNCPITWGANRRVRQQNSIRLGTYSETTGTIFINPVLDKHYVPRYVIKGIVYHEMLHHYLGVAHLNGRRIAHSKTFRQLESRYRHYRRLQTWKEKNLSRLLGRYA